MLHTVFTKTFFFFSLCSGSIQLSDFGLAIVDGAQNKNNIKLSGTVGYVAPEYLLDGMSIEPVMIASLFQCVCVNTHVKHSKTQQSLDYRQYYKLVDKSCPNKPKSYKHKVYIFRHHTVYIGVDFLNESPFHLVFGKGKKGIKSS